MTACPNRSWDPCCEARERAARERRWQHGTIIVRVSCGPGLLCLGTMSACRCVECSSSGCKITTAAIVLCGCGTYDSATVSGLSGGLWRERPRALDPARGSVELPPSGARWRLAVPTARAGVVRAAGSLCARCAVCGRARQAAGGCAVCLEVCAALCAKTSDLQRSS